MLQINFDWSFALQKTLESIQSVYENYSFTKQEQRIGLPIITKKICKFKKNNLDIAANILFCSRKGTYVAYRSNFNGKGSKQYNLL